MYKVKGYYCRENIRGAKEVEKVFKNLKQAQKWCIDLMYKDSTSAMEVHIYDENGKYLETYRSY